MAFYMNQNKGVKRGDIFYIANSKFYSTDPSNEAGRPGIIVSNDTLNEHSPGGRGGLPHDQGQEAHADTRWYSVQDSFHRIMRDHLHGDEGQARRFRPLLHR